MNILIDLLIAAALVAVCYLIAKRIENSRPDDELAAGVEVEDART
jgi:hypothetical protein